MVSFASLYAYCCKYMKRSICNSPSYKNTPYTISYVRHQEISKALQMCIKEYGVQTRQTLGVHVATAYVRIFRIRQMVNIHKRIWNLEKNVRILPTCDREMYIHLQVQIQKKAIY